MRKLVEEFPSQIEEALSIAQSAKLHSSQKEIQNVIITGLGGSGIGGTIVSQMTAKQLKLPVYVNKDYDLPEFCSSNTLVIACSYSGNTEETLSAVEIAQSKGAEIACVSSGGALLEKAQKSAINYIKIPGGLPPRAAFGYSLVQLVKFFEFYGLTNEDYINALKNVPGFLNSAKDTIAKEAEKVADFLMAKIPVLYIAANREGVAVRFRQQLNENSKMLCWHHVYPEMTHNELVGWTERNDDLAVLFMRAEDDHARTQKRMEITKEVYLKYTSSVMELKALGSNPVERSLYLIHLGDWISVLLAEKKGIDPVEVNIISHLKSELAKFEG